MSNINDAKQLILETEIDNVIEESTLDYIFKNTTALKNMIKRSPIKIMQILSKSKNALGSDTNFAYVLVWSSSIMAIYKSLAALNDAAGIAIAKEQLKQLLESMKEWDPAGDYNVEFTDIYSDKTVIIKSLDDFRKAIAEQQANIHTSSVDGGGHILQVIISIAVLIISVAYLIYKSKKASDANK